MLALQTSMQRQGALHRTGLSRVTGRAVNTLNTAPRAHADVSIVPQASTSGGSAKIAPSHHQYSAAVNRSSAAALSATNSTCGRRFLLFSGVIGQLVVSPVQAIAANPGSDASTGMAPSAPSSTPPPQVTPPVSPVPLAGAGLTDEAEKRYLAEEDERRRRRKTYKGRIQELEEIRLELAEKELALLSKEKELLEKEQTVAVLKEELEVERKLRALLTKEKERAEEESALAMGLCTGGAMLP